MTGIALALTLLSGCDADKPVDVFLIAVDTLRVDHVGAYNAKSPAKTPNMDALARDGVRFDDAFSPVSVTGPAFASVMTGRDPAGHGVMVNLFRNGAPLAAEQVTIAERFLAAGYRTAAFVSAFTLRPALGLDQGFSVYNTPGNQNRYGDMTADQMSAWLQVQEGPVFSWYHSFDPHGPVKRFLREGDLHEGLEADPLLAAHIPDYQQIEGYTDPVLYETLYARGVEFADEQVGTVLASIKRTGRYEDAIIILFADHGEGFRERTLWYDHGAFPHVEQTRVPLIVKMPGGAGSGTVDTRLTSLLDIAPTVLSVAQLPPLEHADGGVLTKTGVLHETLSAESSHCKRIPVLKCAPHGGVGKLVAVRDEEQTLVSESRTGGEHEAQYDRLGDPKEWTASLRTAEGPLLEALREIRSDRRKREYPPLPGLPNGQTSDAEERQLMELGYLE